MNRDLRLPSYIAIITDEFVGLKGGGGIGTCARGLAEVLLSAGHKVDVIMTDPAYCDRTPSLSLINGSVALISLAYWLVERGYREDDHISRPYGVYELLRAKPYDIVHLNDWQGSGYFYAMAKRQGLVNAIVVTHTHGPHRWVRTYNASSLGLGEAELETLEVRQVENSDLVVSPSRYLLDWYVAQGVQLPETRVLNWILPGWIMDGLGPSSEPLTTQAMPAGQVNELIFFGRQERRKGLELFLDALALSPRLKQIDLTFLGRFDRIDHEFTGSLVLQRLHKHAGAIRFVNNLDHTGAMNFLVDRPNALCVMPSLIENSPCVVGECLTLRKPFVASAVGGTAELLEPVSAKLALAECNPKELAARLCAVIDDGLPSLRSTMTPKVIVDAWLALHDDLQAQRDTFSAKPIEQPLISICLVHHNRPQLLRRALDAIAKQTYPNIEVVLVDDGSNSASLRQLDTIEQDFINLNLRVLRTANFYLGAARNHAAQHAQGEFLIFHDDDNVSIPTQAELFVKSALHGGYDILTAQYYVFDEDEDPADGKIKYFPIGTGGIFSYWSNRFGDANALVRRSTFLALGGFSDEVGVGWEDYEFFLRAHLSGCRMGMVPEPLFRYRQNADGMLKTTSPSRNRNRIIAKVGQLKPILDADFLRIVMADTIQKEVLDFTWQRLGRLPFSTHHRDLMSLEPNSEDARSKFMDLAFLMGRTADAIEIGLACPNSRTELFDIIRALGHRARNLGAPSPEERQLQRHRGRSILVEGWLTGPEGEQMKASEVTYRGQRFRIVHWSAHMREDANRHLAFNDEVKRGFTAIAISVEETPNDHRVSTQKTRLRFFDNLEHERKKKSRIHHLLKRSYGYIYPKMAKVHIDFVERGCLFKLADNIDTSNIYANWITLKNVHSSKVRFFSDAEPNIFIFGENAREGLGLPLTTEFGPHVDGLVAAALNIFVASEKSTLDFVLYRRLQKRSKSGESLSLTS